MATTLHDPCETTTAIADRGHDQSSKHPGGQCDHAMMFRDRFGGRCCSPWWGRRLQPRRHPLPAGALAFTGFVLPMAARAVLMSLSTVVALNAQLQRRVDLRPA